MVNIVKAKAEDFEAFFALLEENLQNGSYLYPPDKSSYIINEGLPTKDRLKEDILKGDRPLYIAYEDNKTVGYLLTEKTFAGVAFGHWLGIDRKHRNKGIGSKILEFWEGEVRKEGAHAVFLYTTENNVEFYKNRGYTLGGTFPNSWFHFTHFLFYKHFK